VRTLRARTPLVRARTPLVRARTPDVRQLCLILALGLGWACAGRDATGADLTVWTESCLTKVRPSAPAPARLDTTVVLHAVRNEWESFQVVLRAPARTVRGVRIQPGDLVGPEGATLRALAYDLNRVGYVKVQTPSWVGSRAGGWPDPLPPLVQPLELRPDEGNLSIWVTLKIGKGLPPGRYLGAFRVATAEGEEHDLLVDLHLHDAELPDGTGPFTQWFDQDPAEILAAHQVDAADRERAAALLDRYFRFQMERRLPPSQLPVPPDSTEAKAYLTDARLGTLRVGPSSGRDAGPPAVPQSLVPRVVAVMRGDESPRAVEVLDLRSRQLRALGPGARVLATSLPPEDRFDLADLWCLPPTALSLAQRGELQALGARVWWSLTAALRPPAPSLLVDDDGVCPRLLFWLQVPYRVTGLWCPNTTGWSRTDVGGEPRRLNVWSDPETVPGASGAGYLLYPGAAVGVDGPVSSVRLELLREGVEDRLCFHLLETALDSCARKLGAADQQFGRLRCRELVARVASELTAFSRAPEGMTKARVSLLRDLAAASAQPPLLVRSTPPEGTTIAYPGDGIQLSGVTLPGSTMTVNNQPVAVDAKGAFRARAYPLFGANEFVLRACAGDRGNETRRQYTVVQDPALGRLESLLRASEAQGTPLTDARSALSALMERANQGTYTREDGRRAEALATEVARKATEWELSRAPGTSGETAASSLAEQHLIRIAQTLDAKRQYQQALRVLELAAKRETGDLSRPCRAEAGTYFGKVGFRLWNGWVSLIVWRQGGRVVDLRLLGIPLLQHIDLAAVPDNEVPPLSAEVGGLEDALPESNRLSLVNWNLAVVEEFDEQVTLAARATFPETGLKLERRVTLRRSSPDLLLTYQVTNATLERKPFRWRARLGAGVGFPVTGTGGDPAGDLLWAALPQGAGIERLAISGQSCSALQPAGGHLACYDPAFRMGLGFQYDEDLVALHLSSDEAHGRYWIEADTNQTGQPAMIEPGDLRHFTLRLLPMLDVGSAESVAAKLLSSPR